MIVIWAATGLIFSFSKTWRLVINISTTIVTYLVVFLIQSTQNQDSEAVRIQLDETIWATRGPPNARLDLDELGDEDLDKVPADCTNLA